MHKLLLFTVLSTSFLATAYASQGHDHKHEHEHGHQFSKGHNEAKGHHHEDNAMEHHDSNHKGHHGGDHHENGHHTMGHGDSLAGRPGKESEVDRTIKVEANDAMRFVHEAIKVKKGETIKFEILNTGAIPHEFSIGTKDEHMAHG